MTELELLIREIDQSTYHGRIMRENMRRIKQFLDDVEAGNTTLVTFQTIGGSPSAYNRYDSFDVTTNGQTVFTLSATPSDTSKVRMTINGVEQTNGSHFTVSGTTLTFDPVSAGFTLEVSNEFGSPDRVVISYLI